MVSALVMTVNASLLRFSCWFELIKETVSNSCLSLIWYLLMTTVQLSLVMVFQLFLQNL
ncbi:unnamed protein product, partial [Brassica rapa subsp. trilocularis]